METFDIISLFSLIFSLIVIAFSLWKHEKKVGKILENAGLSYPDRVKIQINDPNIFLLGRSWVLAFAALFFIVAMSIILRTGLSGVILIFISIVLSSLLIAWLFGLRIPVLGKELKHPAVPLRRCYQECGISKRKYYKNLSEVSFTLAIFSILFAFGGYVIPYYHGSFSIFGIHILGLHLHSFASALFAVCLFLLVLPMLSDWWRWRK